MVHVVENHGIRYDCNLTELHVLAYLKSSTAQLTAEELLIHVKLYCV